MFHIVSSATEAPGGKGTKIPRKKNAKMIMEVLSGFPQELFTPGSPNSSAWPPKGKERIPPIHFQVQKMLVSGECRVMVSTFINMNGRFSQLSLQNLGLFPLPGFFANEFFMSILPNDP